MSNRCDIESIETIEADCSVCNMNFIAVQIVRIEVSLGVTSLMLFLRLAQIMLKTTRARSPPPSRERERKTGVGSSQPRKHFEACHH